MARKKKALDEQFNVLSNEDISTSNDLTTALELLNKEHVIDGLDVEMEVEKFEVVKRENTDPINMKFEDMLKKTDTELDYITDQADMAFQKLMDLALQSHPKAVGEVSGAAQGFLNIKLNASLAKTETRLKKLKLDLDTRKVDIQEAKMSSKEEEDWVNPNDGIEVIS